ncbi:acyl-CoA dehydrogenase family protein [Streptomyces acidiscabies]|uniref:acyl-CoA dehydrogenase family protein n=1 Tax=Streptomyces acidiscabies TaxID=42234 RepID=UPI00095CCB34|nr:acyl-CoA dehydrogenase family protein [Streptomyces acidiscabies]GAV38296.1 acyl-CoA dehydrogenase [Streptomyces acidiscabies]
MSTEPPSTLDPFLTDNSRRLWEEADAFAEEEIRPRVERMEAAPHRVERKIAKLLAAQRWFGVTIPTEFGGMDAGHVAKTVLIHRIATVSGAAAAILQADLIPVAAVLHFGTDTQRRTLLPAVADGSLMLSIAVTEPDQGGRIASMETIAEQDGDSWVITGTKTHIGNSHLADQHIVVARTGSPGTPTQEALTAFLVEGDRPGLTVSPYQPSLGLRGFSFGTLNLDRVRVGPGLVLGEVGQGHDIAQSSSILYGRPNLAALSLGLHETAVSLTTTHLGTRPRYGTTLAHHDVVRDRLGQMDAQLRMARLLAYHAVHLLDVGLPCDAELIASKGMGHDLGAESGRAALELHGASGLLTNYPLERVWRDMQTTYAPAGTGEVQRRRLAEAALLEQKEGQTGHHQWSVALAHRTRPPLPAAV